MTVTRQRISKPGQRARPRRAPKFRNHQRKNKNRIQNHASRAGPRLKLVRDRGQTLERQAQALLASKSTTNTTLTNHKHKPKLKSKDADIESPKPSSRAVKYQVATQWPSSEPHEMNCLQRDPLPANYVFVPAGNVYITRHCRSKTKESHRLVYKVYDNTGMKALGIRVPKDVHNTVLQSAKETAESRAAAVKLRDEKDLAHSRELLRLQFPLMPDEALETILQHAFLKGSGRVGRTSTTSDRHKGILAVEAHIRHKHTPYDQLLRDGKDREIARETVWPTVQAIRAAWTGQGEGVRPKRLSLRSQSD
ncbi:DUF2293 domain-containing protein [Aspergillus undulatus]|uniref:DUF2293 domain-containing protein n=1 Tax=Aspergillus undulatus TaxID=1810928 RepID=UPI003CCD054A